MQAFALANSGSCEDYCSYYITSGGPDGDTDTGAVDFLGRPCRPQPRRRQEAPHPHEVILDPTGSFIVVPDLGADLIRVFSIDPETSLLTESAPFHAPAGSGPRHGTFLRADCGNTFFFLISELANTIASYEVEYSATGLNFTNVFLSGIYGNKTIPDGAAAAEVTLSVSPSSFKPELYTDMRI